MTNIFEFRAAAALDTTHDKVMKGVMTEKLREIVARWLDQRVAGQKTTTKISFIRSAVRYLEKVR